MGREANKFYGRIARNLNEKSDEAYVVMMAYITK